MVLGQFHLILMNWNKVWKKSGNVYRISANLNITFENVSELHVNFRRILQNLKKSVDFKEF